MTFIPEDDPRVVETVKRIRALRQLARVERMQTYKAQTELLQQVPNDVLATVATVLTQDDEFNRGEFNARHK
jgi:hypothetical protein